ncbi:MAG TPA: 50S ribosomal protein L31e [Candidatus Methanoperedenaceae archaeon]|nr:50S ribosomal protein L31e [Candidatus Methanoperedenaceae archaeon]
MADEKEATVSEERIYTIPLNDARKASRWERSKRATSEVRAFLAKHMKVATDSVRLNSKISETIWERGAMKPPSSVRVKVMKFKDGVVEAELAE